MAQGSAKIYQPHARVLDDGWTDGLLKSTATSPDDRLLAAGFDDGTILLWDLVLERFIGSLRRHADGVYALAFSPDSTSLASGSSDTTIRVWTVRDADGNAVKPNESVVLNGHELDITQLAYSSDGTRLASGALDGTIKIWDTMQQYTLVHSLQNVVWTLDLAFSRDGSKLYSTMDNLLFVWSMADGHKIATLRGHKENIYAIAMSYDGTRLATVSDDHTARVWDVETGNTLLTLRGHTQAVWCVAFSPNDSEIVTGSSDQTIVTYDSRTGDRRHVFQLADGPVNTVQYSSRGNHLCSTSIPEGSQPVIWLLDTRSGAIVGKCVGHTDTIRCAKLTHDDKYVVSIAEDKAVCMFKFDVSEAL